MRTSFYVPSPVRTQHKRKWIQTFTPLLAPKSQQRTVAKTTTKAMTTKAMTTQAMTTQAKPREKRKKKKTTKAMTTKANKDAKAAAGKKKRKAKKTRKNIKTKEKWRLMTILLPAKVQVQFPVV